MSVFSETCSLSLTQATTDVVFVSQFISFQLLSHVRFFATPWTAARQVSLSITKSQMICLARLNLDLSEAFDSVNHKVSVTRLWSMAGGG